MRQILLSTLRIQNFKGCTSRTLDFRGRSASIYGDNAAGKTTVYDALTWLLFGKDSLGQANFDIKPKDSEGNVADHGAVTEVEAVFLCDGQDIALRRTYFEKWSTKRGSSEATYNGNTSEYLVDGVPIQKRGYDAKVSEMVSEELFRTLTSITWFCGGMRWQDRRAILFEVCGTLDDISVMSGNPKFEGLAAAMGRLPLDDYRKKLLAERKQLNGAQNTIPTRLDELKKTEANLAGLDFAHLRDVREAGAQRLAQLQAELVRLGNNTLLAQKHNELAEVRNQRGALGNRNDSHRASQMVPAVDERPVMHRELDRLRRELSRCEQLIANEDKLISMLAERIQGYRDQWAAQNARVFEDSNCPTCGQKMPQEAQDKARAAFEEDVRRAKLTFQEMAEQDKGNLTAAEERKGQYLADLARVTGEISDLEARLAAYTVAPQPIITDLPGYAEEMDKLGRQMAALSAEIANLERDGAAVRDAIQQDANRLQGEVKALGDEIAKEGVLTYTRQRMGDLQAEARATAERLEYLDGMIYLCDEFTRYKAGFIEEAVNDRFKYVRFRLFDQQVNGGLAECCEATVNGVSYASANNGARINAGLDVIGALSEHYGVSVPLFVDNAESVTRLLDVGTQTIRLVVSAEDKELRCEYGS